MFIVEYIVIKKNRKINIRRHAIVFLVMDEQISYTIFKLCLRVRLQSVSINKICSYLLDNFILYV
jgi:hypothetical protein